MRNETPNFWTLTTQALVAPAERGLVAVPDFFRRIRSVIDLLAPPHGTLTPAETRALRRLHAPIPGRAAADPHDA